MGLKNTFPDSCKRQRRRSWVLLVSWLAACFREIVPTQFPIPLAPYAPCPPPFASWQIYRTIHKQKKRGWTGWATPYSQRHYTNTTKQTWSKENPSPVLRAMQGPPWPLRSVFSAYKDTTWKAVDIKKFGSWRGGSGGQGLTEQAGPDFGFPTSTLKADVTVHICNPSVVIRGRDKRNSGAHEPANTAGSRLRERHWKRMTWRSNWRRQPVSAWGLPHVWPVWISVPTYTWASTNTTMNPCVLKLR